MFLSYLRNIFNSDKNFNNNKNKYIDVEKDIEKFKKFS